MRNLTLVAFFALVAVWSGIALNGVRRYGCAKSGGIHKK